MINNYIEKIKDFQKNGVLPEDNSISLPFGTMQEIYILGLEAKDIVSKSTKLVNKIRAEQKARENRVVKVNPIALESISNVAKYDVRIIK